jgi:transcriptional regulator with XRE-family HTH domain
MSSERVKAFGREVRRRRLALDMSLETLAEGAGLSGAYTGEIESGARRPCGLSLQVAFRVADELGVELPELVGFKGLSGPGIEAGRLGAGAEAADGRARAPPGDPAARGRTVSGETAPLVVKGTPQTLSADPESAARQRLAVPAALPRATPRPWQRGFFWPVLPASSRPRGPHDAP